MMAFNYNKLRGRIIECFGTLGKFAEAMGWSEKTLTAKLSGTSYWKQPEILKAMRLLNLKRKDMQDYFFDLKVQRNELQAAE